MECALAWLLYGDGAICLLHHEPVYLLENFKSERPDATVFWEDRSDERAATNPVGE
jgi:hypothetical protein